MRMWLVADVARTVMSVMIQEHEWANGDAVRRRQGAVEQHVAVIDNTLSGNECFNLAIHGGILPGWEHVPRHTVAVQAETLRFYRSGRRS
jgi:uncharacterized protein (UPF0303 family)